MKTVAEALKEARMQLQGVSETPALDANLMLAFVLACQRATLLAWPDKALTADQQAHFSALLLRRLHGEPMAYLLGYREFWSREFQVSPTVLIPRPDTETLVEAVLLAYPEESSRLRLADLGTGSGILAVTLQLERSSWEVHAVDISEEACVCASKNAHTFGCKAIVFHCGSWFNALPDLDFDVIVSNPPYLSEVEWPEYEAGLSYEPRRALVSGEDGLLALREIIAGARRALKPGGRLFLEHGFRQAEAVSALLKQAGYVAVFTTNDQSGQPRVTQGMLSL